MTKQTYNISQLAAEFEMDRRTVAKRIGNIKPVGTEGRSKLYFLKDVAPFLVDFPSEDGLDYHGQRTRLTRLQADKLQKEIEYEGGKYILIEQADCCWTKLVLATRSRLLVMPSKLAPMMIGHKKAKEPFELLTISVREALTELARGETIMAEFINKNDIDVIWQESEKKLRAFCNSLTSEFAERVLSEPLEQWQPDWEKKVEEGMDKIQAEALNAIKEASFPVGDWKDA